jgi:DNA topoisomerase I
MEGSLIQSLRAKLERRLSRSLHRLRPEEAAVMALLQERLSMGTGSHRLRKAA